MKILYFTQLYPPMLYGGGEYIFSKWAERMAKKGHDVTVITQKIVNTKSNEILNGVKVFRIPPAIKYSGALYSISLLKNLIFLFYLLLKGVTISRGCDLIHSNTFVPTFAAEIISKLTGKPHISTIHDVYFQTNKKFWENWSHQSNVGSFSKWSGQFIEKMILKLKPSLIHTVSETSKNDLIKAGKKRDDIAVVPNGINIDEYQIKAAKKPFQFCFIGRLVFYKNIDIVIKSFKNIVDALPEARFIIAGRGPCENELINLTKELNLENNISFIGRITHAHKLKLLAESQLMVQPSLVEGFGITIIESFACGTPVIATNIMPLPELVRDGENGVTIDPYDTQKWSHFIKQYLLNPDKCREHGENGKKMVMDKYTIERITDKIEKLYEYIIQQRLLMSSSR
jgi:glycosyltransferase involved in cell wall biosynthesis